MIGFNIYSKTSLILTQKQVKYYQIQVYLFINQLNTFATKIIKCVNIKFSTFASFWREIIEQFRFKNTSKLIKIVLNIVYLQTKNIYLL